MRIAAAALSNVIFAALSVLTLEKKTHFLHFMKILELSNRCSNLACSICFVAFTLGYSSSGLGSESAPQSGAQPWEASKTKRREGGTKDLTESTQAS